MKRIMCTVRFFSLVFCFSVLVNSCTLNRPDKGLTPGQLADKLINNPEFVHNANGENFCWHARVGLDEFVEHYQLTKDTRWLDAGLKYYDFLISKMATDPDGYKGWIGVYGYNDNYWQDALVGDAILFDGILNFCTLVLEDKNLKQKYGEKAMAYVSYAKKDFIEKWDKRGCWIDDGNYGTYIEFNRYLKSDNLKQWITPTEETRAGISHPFNKQMDAGAVCLKIYRITGEEFYKTRAEKIYFTAKSHFQYFDDHYCWNYFEPLYPGDIDTVKKETRHGVWVHPWRSGYQAGEVEKIAEAYQSGIVFDEKDMKRILNTNLNVMWNKDRVNPLFISSNGLGSERDTTGRAEFRRAWGHSTATIHSGELWTGLLDFDQTIRDLYVHAFKGDTTSDEFQLYRKTVAARPPSFERKYAKGEIKVPELNFTESRELSMAVVLPHENPGNGRRIIVSQSWIAGKLTIDLYTLDNRKVCSIFSGPVHEGTFMITWDGRDPSKRALPKGLYKIRWTIGTGFREDPVFL
jgi:hypothetical protein